MNPFKNDPLTPPQEEPAQPATPAPAPEPTPKRRRFVQPTFNTNPAPSGGRPARVVITGAFVLLLAGAQAQADSSGHRNQGTDQNHSGWVMFNDQMGKDLNISADEMKRLREVDARYATEYNALGKDPMADPRYRTLTDRRTNDIKGIMAKDSYTRWEQRYGANRSTPTTPSGTTPPQGNGTGTTQPKPKTTTP